MITIVLYCNLNPKTCYPLVQMKRQTTRQFLGRFSHNYRLLRSPGLLQASLFFLAAMLFSWGENYATPGIGADPSWAEGLVNATDKGWIYGKDIIYTFGPYHQLYTHQISNNLNAFLFGRWILGLSAGAAALSVSRFTSMAWSYALTISLWLLPGRNPDALFAVMAILLCLAVSIYTNQDGKLCFSILSILE
jgi:hypothetical protein